MIIHKGIISYLTKETLQKKWTKEQIYLFLKKRFYEKNILLDISEEFDLVKLKFFYSIKEFDLKEFRTKENSKLKISNETKIEIETNNIANSYKKMFFYCIDRIQNL